MVLLWRMNKPVSKQKKLSNTLIAVIAAVAIVTLYLIYTVAVPFIIGDGLSSFSGVKREVAEKSVEEFLNDLDSDKRLQVDTLRDLILKSETQLEEHIKWNAPSYVLDGEDRITFNLMNKQGVVKLVIHMGATRKENKKGSPVMRDESGLIEWSSDIRGMITFHTIENINSNLNPLKKIIKDWLSIPSV
jgi:hypothetical protein